GDRLALAVLVRREQEFVRILEQSAELSDLFRPVGADDIESLEVVVDVDAQGRPRLGLELGRNVGSVARQIAEMAVAGLQDVSGAKVARDRLRLGRRLDDHEALGLGVWHRSPHRSSPPLKRGACPSCAAGRGPSPALTADGCQTVHVWSSETQRTPWDHPW